MLKKMTSNNIMRCNICGSWIASTNIASLEQHKKSCDRGFISKEAHLVKNKAINRVDYTQMIRCTAEVSGIKMKIIALHVGRGKFKILTTSLYEHRRFVGKIIDSSDINEVIL